MTRYRSKKDSSIEAHVDSVSEKYGTTMLVYDTGEKTGTAFSISNSTLKRWWKKIDNDNPLDIDVDKVNEPYPEPEKQEYVPIPESVKEYEETKRMRRMGKNKNVDTPKDLETIAIKMGEKSIPIKKVNTGYISLIDRTKIKVLDSGIGILASADVGETLSKIGMQSRPCIESGTPFRFDISKNEDFEKALDAISNITLTDSRKTTKKRGDK